ncbi:Flp pilus assembly complex ATPase component TadA [Candidatus Parcubacteria bacterium]|nr:Flp pilus assembly complex ATPase component TadA [Candidatus Parcubacteria bacterium]
MSFLDELAKKGLIKKGDMDGIVAEAEEGGISIDAVLAHRNVNEKEVLNLKSQYLGIPAKFLDGKLDSVDILKYIPEESAVHYKFVPLAIENGVLEVGVIDPENLEARDALQFIGSKLNLPYKVYLITPSDFEAVLGGYKGLTGEVTKALSELDDDIADVSGVALNRGDEGGDEETKGNTKIIEDAPVTKIVAVILRHATEGGASDIHIENLGDKVKVRFRVDGTLHTSLLLPVEIHSAIAARIKILANLKLDEKRKPQDGRFSARIDGRRIDFRVSTFPSHYGEKVEMRILDTQKGVKSLEELGLSRENAELMREAIRRPYGLILLTGPTGSGKTTTLYSMLNEIDRETKNVLSLEDPVEYNIPDMSQSQVLPEIGYTFASGLRSILRQDPDVIMVGEIRDKETAQLAIQAALTGHLVFSTLHTNNAIGVIPRLIDMGVDPYLIAPTLILAAAQRLVRQICPDAASPLPVEGSIKVIIEKQFADLAADKRSQALSIKNMYEAKPTPSCPSGTRGRMAVFEVMKIDKDIEQIILTNPTEERLWQAARAKGMLTMREDAILKSAAGLVPFQEVNTL